MVLRELQLLSKALWEGVQHHQKFFSPINSFVKEIAEFDYSALRKEQINELNLYSTKIEEFFAQYRHSGEGLYIQPSGASSNDKTVRRIYELVDVLKALPQADLLKEIESVRPKEQPRYKGGGHIFIGHGRSKLWARVQVYLKDELGLNTLSFESESRTSESIINILDDFLKKSSYAILVMTAEDETKTGETRARQNVIHEAGLFQGRLGFDKVIILKQEGTENFSNISGLQHIPFSGENIEQTFYELHRKLKKAALIK